MNSVMSFRPKEDELYYKGFSATVIYIVKSIATEKEGRGWKRFPRNVTDLKGSILKIIINLRKLYKENNTYMLYQDRLLGLL